MAHSKLLFATPNAAQLLVFTKSTRLNMTPDSFVNAMNTMTEDLEEELKYMAGTIPSSWEFVDVTFLLSDVSRAAAQQITRTRNASFAMQSLRVVDGSDLGYENPFDEELQPELFWHFDEEVQRIQRSYTALLDKGATPQDARGILPLNIHCNLVAKYNLRAFVELCQKRESLRTQGEYADLVQQMKHQVLQVWPWAEPFFVPKHQAAIEMLEEVVRLVGMEVGKGYGWQIAKAIDLLRNDK